MKLEKGKCYRVENNTFMEVGKEIAEYHSSFTSKAGEQLHRMIYIDFAGDLEIGYFYDSEIYELLSNEEVN